ncbi:ADP-ribosylglycohydrolase family protein [Amycolatopsis minnesotensis]|uniref:ADP-ribosylglycohydrolase family protein n=1 Tax=Amycolatopsis minnesotensis TaxID=337894 RepID=A0ABP5CMX8_9PSEU
MERAEAVTRAEDWLAAARAADPGGTAIRADHDRVRRVPEGWAVPYDTVAWLDEGAADRRLFPPPVIVVTEPDGELRLAAPEPGGISVPLAFPGTEHWREIVDPEYADAGVGLFGVPEAVIAGWARVDASGQATGEQKENPAYRTGPIRRGYPRPENFLETVLLFGVGKWLSRAQVLTGVAGAEVVVPLDPESGEIPRGYYRQETPKLQVFTSTRWLPPDVHHWWHVDVARLAAMTPPPDLDLWGPPTMHTVLTGTELAEACAEWPRAAEPVDVRGACPESDEPVAAAAAEAAGKLGLAEPVEPPVRAATLARKRGFELTEDECRRTVLGKSWLARRRQPDPPDWPADLAANGLVPGYGNDGGVEPALDTFGKYFPLGLPGFRYGWERVTGAYVGFAIGEALGAAVDKLSLHEITTRYGPEGVTGFETAYTEPGQLGPLTQRLLFMTEAVIRSPHREDHQLEGKFGEVARNGVLRWLHTQGVPLQRVDGWLLRRPELHVKRDPQPSDLESGPTSLLAALPAALTDGGPGSGLDGGTRQAARLMAGQTTRDQDDLEAVTYLTWVWQEMLSSKAIVLPAAVQAKETASPSRSDQHGPAWDRIRAAVEAAAPVVPSYGLPSARDPETIGDGHDTLSVLGRTIAAVGSFENFPRRALRRAVNHSGRSALTGALAGALLGARLGIPGLPADWVGALELRHLVENVATDAFWHYDRHSALWHDPEHWKARYPQW